MSKRYIGIDIGGTAVKIGYVTAEGELLATDSKRVDFDHYQTPIIVTVKNAVDQFLALEHITPCRAVWIRYLGDRSNRHEGRCSIWNSRPYC